ncbi:MAG: TIM barrel protein [Lachnospiraceae bacterium]|nr:TIM barrel protein [Lachnospiraceae bacterium]
MKAAYLSAYNFGFSDYEAMKKYVDEFTDFPLGVEFATSWTDSDFYEKLDRQIEVFRGVPVTIHSPFVEICTVPGSEEEKYMEACFTRACEYYKAFHATSMVFHTNEGSFPQAERPDKRKRTKEVLLKWNEKLQAQGIHMTVENVGYPKKDNLLFDFDDFIRLFEELPDEIGCLIDTGHAMLNNWDIAGLIKILGSRVRGYHLNNNDGINDIHYPLYDPEGYYSGEKVDSFVRAIALYSPEADIAYEYAPMGRFTQESTYEDIRRVARVMEETLKQQS